MGAMPLFALHYRLPKTMCYGASLYDTCYIFIGPKINFTRISTHFRPTHEPTAPPLHGLTWQWAPTCYRQPKRPFACPRQV
ncbi:hypothetical protein HanXRQr2_Chr07g0302761 [Helianthus annuus]|uniref:Uncharacterized protein n=1 Tax=Helianthus annuus TaxID=4232 RepID=A0A251UC85_HELAN|nr:hypothetical protein HanXRQr2_Chr07g0302761 [Helianthus annuus]KAJ0905357.1 hypothetical protein HanPSC8_Chr07g0293031 [Helianthus annuus]